MQRSHFVALALAGAGLLIHTPALRAQTSRAPEAASSDSARTKFDPIGRLLERRSELQITDEQATRLEAIRSEYLERNRARIEALRREHETRSSLRASMDSARTEVMAVLTPEQESRIAEMRREGRRGKHHHRR